ncbi:toll/interleukin-1 receptor domain-containing protein [Kutzneria sp. NPDC052558]|uniref:toll/interleukin-1 receptor domain-containing protein n=1 Tax=Kutzneria sp. NPDC052558 TaxID=3364121 RepID=UPI0037C6BFA3
MSHADQPKVFISFAGPDRPSAARLGQELARRGLEPFVDVQGIPAGGNIVLAIDHAITQSDFFVLLWSKHTVQRPWVTHEYTIALGRDLDREPAFLFVVRLDDTPVPASLSMRKYLEVAIGWDSVADQLTDAWRRDRALGLKVLPALDESPTCEPDMVVYVRNRALSVAHLVRVPTTPTAEQLMDSVRRALLLPDKVTELAGKVGMTFHYRLSADGKPIATSRLAECDVVDLEVDLEPWGPAGPLSRFTFREDGPGGPAPAMIRKLVNAGLGHLRPRQR